MKAFFVYNQEQDADYIVIPTKGVKGVTPKVLSDFLYESEEFVNWTTDNALEEIDSPEDLGVLVAGREIDKLEIYFPDLWEERKAKYDW